MKEKLDLACTIMSSSKIIGYGPVSVLGLAIRRVDLLVDEACTYTSISFDVLSFDVLQGMISDFFRINVYFEEQQYDTKELMHKELKDFVIF